MPTSTAVTGGVVLDPGDGNAPSTMQIVPNATEPGWADVQQVVNGEVVSTPTRYKLGSAGRISADFPACDPTHVITDADGHITAG